LSDTRSQARIARASAALLRAVVEEGSVARETKELCGLMVAWLNGCDRCVSSHQAYARRLGVPREKLDALFDYARDDAFDDAQRAALSAAVALTREPRALPPPVREALERHYVADQVFEILSAIGAANYLTRVNNALAEAGPEVPCAPPGESR
jgi:AhpD family alkylhydroperoxidase